MRPQPLLALEDADAAPGVAESELTGHREAEDAPSDDGDGVPLSHENARIRYFECPRSRS